MWPFSRQPVVPVLRFSGPIGMATPLRPGLSLASYAGAIEKAFSASKLPGVAVVINSPGGSPVQSNLIFKRLRQMAIEKKKRIYVFCEDVAASGGYFLAIAGDEIYADPSSIIGSIGVVSRSFGFVDLLERIGVERRVYTAGTNKNQLDPFLPENPEDIERLKAIQQDVHDVFIGLVKERRVGKLKGRMGSFSRAPSGPQRKRLNSALSTESPISGRKCARSSATRCGSKSSRPSEEGFFPAFAARLELTGLGHTGLAFADDLVSAMEERTLWSRFGI